PPHGVLGVPRNTVVAVAWDHPLDASTLTTATFQMAEMRGAVISGSVAYDAAAQTATFAPNALLAPYTTYVITLTAGITDTLGNATFDPTVWAFTTGRAPGGALAFTGSYADWGQDANGDGLYEQLGIRVGVQVTATGSYVLRGSLVDVDGGEITWAYITSTLTAGAHFLDLAFDGAAIGGHGVDGPYALTDLTLVRTDGAVIPKVLASTSQRDAYRTFAYAADRFPAPLHFGGLPDALLIPGTTFLNAFNVRDYAHHATLASDQLSYTVMLNTNPKMDVALQTSGAVYLSPEQYWQGTTHVTVRASDGIHTVQDTFEAAVGWTHTVYLPVVLRNYGITIRRDAWITKFSDNFESDTIGWRRSGWTYKEGDPPPGGYGWYLWGLSECRAYSGQQSAWAYGGYDDGELLPCGAAYPDAYSLGTILTQTQPINLKYVAKGEYSAKVWTNLAPDDEVCLKVAVLESGDCGLNTGWKSGYYGVCRTGVTNGWEDLTLDLTNVPTLGNVLGEEVCEAVIFSAHIGDSRPEGAYVDDVTMRFCPEGLTDLCAGTGGIAPPVSPPPVAGNISGYPEAVSEAALAVDASGRIYALWTGKLNPDFNTYVFYSSSSDGVTWTPYQILSYWGGREPQIAVDNIHGRVHLAYGSVYDGIVHHTVVNGVVSAPVVVVPQNRYYLPGYSDPSGSVAWPSLSVAEETGYAYL
ncbi:MAG: Ig-like domain-containing protein, partial [Burkholderiales bacterium]|nr:Ig-like domain-containing protein [Burkholderiales bacterium]